MIVLKFQYLNKVKEILLDQFGKQNLSYYKIHDNHKTIEDIEDGTDEGQRNNSKTQTMDSQSRIDIFSYFIKITILKQNLLFKNDDVLLKAAEILSQSILSIFYLIKSKLCYIISLEQFFYQFNLYYFYYQNYFYIYLHYHYHYIFLNTLDNHLIHLFITIIRVYMQPKKKICKFKENCPSWIAKIPCGFDHVQCKFKDFCKDKDKCIFYHVSKPSFDKPKSQTLCKFNGVCNKPNCPFKHEKGAQKVNDPMQKPALFSNPDKFNRQCKFGAQCKKTNCSFKHPNRDQNNNSNQQGNKSYQTTNLFGNQQKNQMNSQNNVQLSSNRQNIIAQNKFCLNYLLDNSCQNGQSCRKSHDFCQKGSIKRVYFSTQGQDRNMNISFFQHAQHNQGGNTKQIIYVMQQNETIQFRKLISASNLYEDFGGIDPNGQNKTYLRSISSQNFRSEGVINGIETFSYLNNEYLIYSAQNKIFIYNITTGQNNPYQTQTMNIKLTGCVLIQQKGVILVSTSQQQLKRFDYNSERKVFQLKPINQRYEFKGLKMMKVTSSPILGQKVIFGINSQQNKIVLLNQQFKSNAIQFPSGNVVNDLEIVLANNKIPICLATVSSGSRHHQLISINLLNMQKQTIMACDQTSGLNKIKIVENHLMIQIRNKGILIYRMNEFQKSIGMIPLLNEIKTIKSDQKGNLLIQEAPSVDSLGSISIFKVKRI